MHARRRSPGNGYRPSSMGLGGVGAASRISPESSARGHGMYGSEYRNYGRGFEHGQSKPFQGPAPPPRKTDMLLEAGRLATEYLVSKGLLPPNVFSGKWQNGSLKNHMGEFQGFRPQEGDSLHLPSEGRTSALLRLGGPVPNLGPSKKRFADEFSPSGSRNHLRGKRRMGSFKSYCSEWGREIGKSAMWSEKGRVSPDKDGDDNSFPEYQDEQQADKDVSSVVQKSLASELAPSNVINATSESPVDKFQVQDDMGSKASSFKTEKDLPPKTDVELCEKPGDSTNLNGETVQAKDCAASNEVKEQSATKEDEPFQPSATALDSARKNDCNLLSFCRFAKVPTKIRSSLIDRGSKVDPVPVAGEEKNHEIVPRMESEVAVENVLSGGYSSDISSNQIQRSKCLDSDILKEPHGMAAAKAEELDAVDDEEEKHTQARHSYEGPFPNQKESNERPLEFEKCGCSMVLERGEERAGEHVNSIEGSEGTNKPREWVASVVKHDTDFLQPGLMGKESMPEVCKTAGGEEEVFPMDQVRPVDITLLSKDGGGPCMDYAEEKQLSPGSFKICDLNLMEASDANHGYDADPLFLFPSMPERKKAMVPMDIDLSMSSNSNLSDKYGRRSSDGKVVEVIDLEHDTVQEDKAFDNSDRKTEGVFSGLENFPNHTQNTNDISADQDGYGLMISELLGTDISSCSSVPENISLHNNMALHGGEGILGDDESIYMSLGEIPISFLPVWEQPTQDYGKPF